MNQRLGKTEKDKKSGAKQRNQDNKTARVNWQHSINARGVASEPFPRSACNGKSNRFRYTGKGNHQVIL